MDNVNLNIVGDVFLGGRIESMLIRESENLFDKKILEFFSTSDLNIINLESPLTNAGKDKKINKTGPNLKASPETIKALKVLKVDLVTLANNHIYDYGQEGLSDTLKICMANDIDTVGAGQNLSEASQTYFKKIKNIKIGIVNFAENEWCNANENRGGANPMNIIENVRAIQKAKEVADIVLVVIHGGHELYHYPSPRMIDQYRFYAEQGASLIIGHHSHCVSGYEIHNKVPIFYSLGNFLFDSTIKFEGWYQGILLNIEINSDKEIEWKIIPFKQINSTIQLLKGDEKTVFENKIKSINKIIANPERIRDEFQSLIRMNSNYTLSIFSTSYFVNNRYFRAIVRRMNLEGLFLRKSQLKSILNYMRCEAHSDITSEVILNYINKNEDSNT